MAEYEKGLVRTDRGLFIDKGNQVWDVTHPDFEGGAFGDGYKDDTKAIQKALDEVPDGGTVYFPAGTYKVTAQLSWTNKKLHLVFAEGASLVEGHLLSVTLLRCTGGDGSTIDNCTIEGAESEATYDGLDSTRYGIAFVGVDNGWIRNATISGKSKGIGLLNACNNVRVMQPTINGFFTGEPEAGKNYHQGVTVISGTGCRIEGIIAQNLGSAVLAGTTPKYLEVVGGKVTNFWDNGIYISSGNFCKVTGFTAENGGTGSSSGIKARGNGNIVSGCTTINTRVGITITGNLAVADAWGNNGYGNIVADCIIAQPAQYGLYLDAQDGFYARHGTVRNVTVIQGATGAGNFGAIAGWADHTTISDCTIVDCKGANLAAMIFIWTNPGGDGAASAGTGLKIQNVLIDGSDADGVRISNATQCVVENVRGRDLDGGDLIDARNCTGCEFIGNRALDEGDFVLRVDSNSSNCRIEKNFGDRGAGNGRSHVIAGSGHIVDIRDRGTPEGFFAAAVGGKCQNIVGGEGTTDYTKESGTGNTGWVGK